MKRAHLIALCAVVCIACGGQPHGPKAPAAAEAKLLPARLRVLSSAELERALTELLGSAPPVAGRLAKEIRQSGYTRNADQPWLPSDAVRWDSISREAVSAALAQHFAKLWPCPAANPAPCRDAVLDNWALTAWRRPATGEERQELQALWSLGAAQGDARGGAALVLTALLQSSSFLYQSELGEAISATETRLDAYETAQALSFTLSGAPPDASLLSAAAAGQLRQGDQRARTARSILGRSNTRHHFRRFVLEWLEVDQLQDTAKDAFRFPAYDPLKQSMLDETANFADQVFITRGASVDAFLTAGFVSVDADLARFYGLDAMGPQVSSAKTARLGILQHASVLAAHSHPDITSPVKRGDFVLRRLLCKQLPRPAELGLEIVMPVPKPNETTLQRIERHSNDPNCSYCHRQIDPVGMAFENFDASGRALAAGEFGPLSREPWQFDGEAVQLTDSLVLARWLAARPDVHSCFARQAFRYFSAQSDPGVETAFLELVDRLPESKRSNLIEMLVAYAASDLFVTRRRMP